MGVTATLDRGGNTLQEREPLLQAGHRHAAGESWLPIVLRFWVWCGGIKMPGWYLD